MKVKELIEKLKKCDQELPVIIFTYHDEYEEITDICEEKEYINNKNLEQCVKIS